MTVSEKLLKAVKERGASAEPFGCGITTADHYVRTLQECAGSDLCYRYAATRQESFDDILRKSAKTLVYRNQDMVTTKEANTELHVKSGMEVPTIGVDFKASTEDGIELPKDTLVVFRHILTTPRKDRDGDILRTQGAELDPKMLLLWQHVHALPIGKMVGVVEHNSKRLEIVSAIVDMNDLCHDAAVMVENDMARFSHGFRALEFDQLKDDNGNLLGGFDIKSFEIMEASVVSIPSNKDAETQEIVLSLVEGGKLTSPIMKEVGKNIRSKRALQLPGAEIHEQDESDAEGQAAKGCACRPPAKENDDASAGKEGCGGCGQGEGREEPESKDTEVESPEVAAAVVATEEPQEQKEIVEEPAPLVALEPTVTELAGAFLAKSSPEDRARLLKALETIKQVEANNELAEQYRALQ